MEFVDAAVPPLTVVTVTENAPPGAIAPGGLLTLDTRRSGRPTRTCVADAAQLFVSDNSITLAVSSAQASSRYIPRGVLDGTVSLLEVPADDVFGANDVTDRLPLSSTSPVPFRASADR